jgi:hypothetical protein
MLIRTKRPTPFCSHKIIYSNESIPHVMPEWRVSFLSVLSLSYQPLQLSRCSPVQDSTLHVQTITRIVSEWRHGAPQCLLHWRPTLKGLQGIYATDGVSVTDPTFHFTTLITGSRVSSVSIYSVWLRAGRLGDRGSIPGGGKGFFL